MARFLKELVKDDGLASYGEESVGATWRSGAADTLLLSSASARPQSLVRARGHTKADGEAEAR